jgi:hypothetical protein
MRHAWIDGALSEAMFQDAWTFYQLRRAAHGRHCPCAECAMAREALRGLLDDEGRR